MNMSKLSVLEAAKRLGVSPARVRQRIDDGSLIAEKVGGRWLVDLDASQPAPAQRGRPVLPSSVWWSLASAEIAKAALPNPAGVDALSEIQRSIKPVVDAAVLRKLAMPAVNVSQLSKALKPAFDVDALRMAAMPALDMSALQAAIKPAINSAALVESLLPRMRLAELILANAAEEPNYHSDVADQLDVLATGFVAEAMSLSRSSRSRAVHRFVRAVVARDYADLLAWLSNRASRNLYVVAKPDLDALRSDDRLIAGGVSHPDSNLEDPRIVEAYIAAADLEGVVSDYWLEKPVVDERPNVVLHVAPVRPAEVGPMLLAADLAEHGGPREVQRAHELLGRAIDALVSADPQSSAHDDRAPA